MSDIVYRRCCASPVFDPRHRPECEIGQAAAELAARERREQRARTVYELELERENERLRLELADARRWPESESERLADELRYQLIQNHSAMVASAGRVDG